MSKPDTKTPRFGWSVTREGWWWLVSAVLVIIGIIKGINLLILLGSVLILAWAINAWTAWRGLAGIRLKQSYPDQIFARESFAVIVEVENQYRKARFGLRVEDQGPDHGISWFLPRLSKGEKVHLSARITIARRGRYLGNVRAVSGAPFGLVEASVAPEQPLSIMVYPRQGHLRRGKLRGYLTLGKPSWDRDHGHRPAPHPAAQDELHGVRTFRTGDSPRWIHWRTSARRGQLMVREFDETPADDLIIIVDPWIPDPPASISTKLVNPALHPLVYPDMEKAISLAATVCREWCRQKGDRLVLAVAGNDPLVASGVTGRDLAHRVLSHLGETQGCSHPDVDLLLRRLGQADLATAPILLISSRPRSFSDQAEAWFRRPVTFVDASHLSAYDFYDQPADPPA